MKPQSPIRMLVDVPKLLVTQAVKPLRLAIRRPQEIPATQHQFAQMVEEALSHEIRAGFSHRFITLLFVTVDDRVFCRRYSYSEPSWHSAFRDDPLGQVKLDKTIVTIEARAPDDLQDILPAVDQAYVDKLKQLSASFLLSGAVEKRAQDSTIELTLSQSVSTT